MTIWDSAGFRGPIARGVHKVRLFEQRSDLVATGRVKPGSIQGVWLEEWADEWHEWPAIKAAGYSEEDRAQWTAVWFEMRVSRLMY